MEVVGGKGIIKKDKGNFDRLKATSNCEEEGNATPQAIVGHEKGGAPTYEPRLPATNNSGRYA